MGTRILDTGVLKKGPHEILMLEVMEGASWGIRRGIDVLRPAGLVTGVKGGSGWGKMGSSCNNSGKTW